MIKFLFVISFISSLGLAQEFVLQEESQDMLSMRFVCTASGISWFKERPFFVNGLKETEESARKWTMALCHLRGKNCVLQGCSEFGFESEYGADLE